MSDHDANNATRITPARAVLTTLAICLGGVLMLAFVAVFDHPSASRFDGGTLTGSRLVSSAIR